VHNFAVITPAACCCCCCLETSVQHVYNIYACGLLQTAVSSSQTCPLTRHCFRVVAIISLTSIVSCVKPMSQCLSITHLMTCAFVAVLFCSLAVLDPRVGHTMDVLLQLLRRNVTNGFVNGEVSLASGVWL